MDSTRYSSPFLCSVSDAIRVRHYSRSTEKAYIGWVKHFIYFHNKQHPREMGAQEVSAFLTYLAVNRNVAPSTQNQAFNALMFLYRAVLDQPIEDLNGVARAKTRQKIPVVLTREEVPAVLKALDGIYWLAACLMYGSGLQIGRAACRERVTSPV